MRTRKKLNMAAEPFKEDQEMSQSGGVENHGYQVA